MVSEGRGASGRPHVAQTGAKVVLVLRSGRHLWHRPTLPRASQRTLMCGTRMRKTAFAHPAGTRRHSAWSRPPFHVASRVRGQTGPLTSAGGHGRVEAQRPCTGGGGLSLLFATQGCTLEEGLGPAVFAAAGHSFAPPEFPARRHGNDPAGAKWRVPLLAVRCNEHRARRVPIAIVGFGRWQSAGVAGMVRGATCGSRHRVRLGFHVGRPGRLGRPGCSSNLPRERDGRLHRHGFERWPL